MQSLHSFVAPPSQCGYLPDQIWSLKYEHFLNIRPKEYLDRMNHGWRRFGATLFRPRCPSCTACQPLRVLVDQFQPDRSQRRNRHANRGSVELRIGEPTITEDRLALYDRYHAYQAETKGWPDRPVLDVMSYVESFVDNPFPTREYSYYLENRLVGVGFVDDLPRAYSAIYFYYDPDERRRGLGTWNVLSILDRARANGIPYLYLGYFVRGCESMAYKARFRPHELLSASGMWR
jgi:arginyl-tRNA--protein-N-Asp/Glu arginylyltransferase